MSNNFDNPLLIDTGVGTPAAPGDYIGFGRAANTAASTGPRIYAGTGNPTGTLTAPAGSLWLRTDTSEIYQNSDGATAWVLASAAATGTILGPATVTANSLVQWDGATANLVKELDTAPVYTPDFFEVNTTEVFTNPTTELAYFGIYAADDTTPALRYTGLVMRPEPQTFEVAQQFTLDGVNWNYGDTTLDVGWREQGTDDPVGNADLDTYVYLWGTTSAGADTSAGLRWRAEEAILDIGRNSAGAFVNTNCNGNRLDLEVSVGDAQAGTSTTYQQWSPQRVRQNVTAAAGTWTAITTFAGAWTNLANYHPCAYRLHSNGMLELRGVAVDVAGAGSAQMFTLPAGFRPTNYAAAGTVHLNPAAPGTYPGCIVWFDTAGPVEFSGQLAAANTRVYLDGVFISLG